MASSTLWQRVKSGSKTGFDKAYAAVDKLGPPINKLSNKIGSEAFWPTTLDKESDKAARILKSFCKDGFYTEEEYQPADNGPKQKQRVVKKIPMEVIRNAKALAIFTTMRTGLWVSGAGGSGVLIARQEDGKWSPPSGIMLHTAGLGFMVGIDIYDAVVVINSAKALEAFYNVRCTLGSEVSVVAGPVGVGGVLETELHKRQAPVFNYMKSRGFYAGVQIDGTIIIERTDENERFYGEKIGVKDILNGKVRHPPFEVRRLLETIKAAQGDKDVDEAFLPTEAPPGDFEVDDGHMFGVPDKEDPDPYGVLALEKEGMGVREAATKARASWVDFTFAPSPTSPVHKVYQRHSGEHSFSRPVSWRKSGGSMTNLSMTSSGTGSASARPMAPPPPPRSLRTSTERAAERPVLMTSTATQTTEEDLPPSPSRNSKAGSPLAKPVQTPPALPITDSTGSLHQLHNQLTPPRTPPAQTSEFAEPSPPPQLNGATPDETSHHGMHQVDLDDDHDDLDDDDVHIEEPVVHSVQTVRAIQPTSPVAIAGGSKARVVTVGKRIPPKLPPRNPNRVGDGSPTRSETSVEPMPTEIETETDSNEHHTALPALANIDTATGTKDVDRSSGQRAAHDSPSLGQMMRDVKLDDDDDEDVVSPMEPGIKLHDAEHSAGEGKENTRVPEPVRTSMPGGFD
nr:hypothetical protein B0A51_01706 [Rachicladosporium sp. CCFEE 5018]